MYSRRIKIFIILSAVSLLLSLVRLMQMQLRDDSFYRDKIAKLKLQQGLSRQLKTVRGRILDRKGRVLAVDELQFQLHINYRLSRYYDDRVRQVKLLRAAERNDNVTQALSEVRGELEAGLEDLQSVIDKCTYFGLERADIEKKIKRINNEIWNLRAFLAWRRDEPSEDILTKYDHRLETVPLTEAMADFEQRFPDQQQRLLLTAGVDDIAELENYWPLLDLNTDDDVFTAQMEFLDIDGVKILPKAKRYYPFSSLAAQTIGWVGPATKLYQLPLVEKLAEYLSAELCGREHVEYVCESVLRGKRGEVVYDIDRQVVSRTETQFGKDVPLTLDAELQQRIENYLSDCDINANCNAPMAVVVIDVATGEILAMVSLPVFDLNRIRYDYDDIVSDPNKPLINRVINKQYPPGSVVKPLILIAGLESGQITTDEIISCPARKAPRGWPSCWLYNRYRTGHDDRGPNYARNAVKGSCNIYFSRLASRIEPVVLQQWLFNFGYGRKALPAPAVVQATEVDRNLRQAFGIISSSIPKTDGQLPPLKKAEERFFGIGQGNLRATPLQVANAMAAVARGGLYRPPRLFVEENGPEYNSVALDISPHTLDVVRDGMAAVVSEPGGTAYREFAHSGFIGQGIEVCGKTGSTEAPENAWFAGFAEDQRGRSVAIAVIVEGGQHGSSDAAPLARDIIQFCVEAGYIGPRADEETRQDNEVTQ